MSLRTDSIPNYETVMNIVRTWPPTQRVILVQEVLSTLAPEAPSTATPQPTLPHALGLLAAHHPAPSDAEINTWLDEWRQERLGG